MGTMERAVIVTILMNGLSNAHPPAMEFGSHFTDKLLLIHPLANYQFAPSWQLQWHDSLYRANSVRSNFGSVTLTELLSDSRITINERLHRGLWFRYAHHWYEDHHIDREISSRFIGLEQYIWKGLSVYCYGDLDFDKENADIRFGVSYSDSTRRRYARLSVLDEDEFYDEKNDRGGTSSRRPIGIMWSVNQAPGRFTIFSEGRYSRGFNRSFSDTARSCDITSHESAYNWARTHVTCRAARSTSVECTVFAWEFEDAKQFRHEDLRYAYSHDMWWLNIMIRHRLRDQFRCRIGSFLVRQRASSSGDWFLSHERNETLPYCFIEWERPFGVLEVGYMGSFHEWEYADDTRTDSRDGYVDKIKLGYSYAFSPAAAIGLSISHVVAIEEFGGGNAQFILFF